MPEPFAIEVNQADLDDLHRRLKNTRWPDLLPGSGWPRGAALDYVYWRGSFDWPAPAAELNAHPQYTTVVEGQTAHFLHMRSPQPDALPLMLVHGWPGSIVEFLDAIELLTAPTTGPPFHLVVPSIPVFAFSTPLREPGWTTPRIARVFAVLMRRLGYHRYGVHGGDWGARIAPDVGRVDPARVAGVHSNAATVGFIPHQPLDEAKLDVPERDRLTRPRTFRSNDSAYLQLHATTPQILALGLNDSPAGLLAWIGEKFHNWSHRHDRIDRDRLLTNVTLHWLCGTSSAAAQLYFEHAHTDAWLPRSPLPTSVAVFAENLAIRRSAEQLNAIVHWTEFDRGGHFAALEEPELLAADIQTFFNQRSTP